MRSGLVKLLDRLCSNVSTVTPIEVLLYYHNILLRTIEMCEEEN